MSFRLKKVFRSGMVLTFGQGLGQFFSLLRNAMYGHFLSPEDFGIAAIFSLTISAVEMSSDMGADKLLIQSKDGNDTSFQNTVHFYNFFRGVITASILFFISPYVAVSFGIEQADWAFYLLSLVVFVRGFIHLDIKRFQREMNFHPFVKTELIPQIVTVILTYPLVLHFNNYDAVIYLIVLHALFYVLMSHMLAKRKYKIEFNASILKKIFSFGWPLILNGILMYLVFQGDKFFIGINYDLKVLGIYSAAFMVSMVPALFIVKIIRSMLLPIFARVRDDSDKLEFNYLIATEIVVFIALFFANIFICFGDLVLVLVFGDQFQGFDKLIASLGIMWSLRIIRVPATLFAMSKGDTKVGLVANVFRSLALGGVYYLAINRFPIEMIAYCGCAGEVLALFFSILQIRYKFKVQFFSAFIRIFLFLLFVLVSTALMYYFDLNFENEVFIYTGLISFLFLLWICFSTVFKYFKNYVMVEKKFRDARLK